MRVLLHTCCAPCASHCIGVLKELGHEITLFYSNSNIAPQEEFQKRLESVVCLAKHFSIPLIVDEYLHGEWLDSAAKGFEGEKEKGARCERCFRFALGRTHAALLKNGFEGFTSSLSVSPHKNTPTLFSVGRAIDSARFLAINFKKDDGFKHSLQLSESLGLYRQTYCGCEFCFRN